MLLAIDVGNTATKLYWGNPADDHRESRSFKNLASTKMFLDSLRPLLKAFSEKTVEFCAISSVVPKINSFLASELQEFGYRYQFLDFNSAPQLKSRYETPETVGADRLANAIYLAENCLGPSICIDFGTATNMDVVDVNREFLGGAILPGVSSMISSLSYSAAQLPKIQIQPPIRAIGRSTKECLQSGTVLALAKAVEGLIAEFKKELFPEPPPPYPPPPAGQEEGEIPFPQSAIQNPKSEISVVATGGHADLMAPLCPSIQKVVPNLTLEGLLIAARRWSEMEGG